MRCSTCDELENKIKSSTEVERRKHRNSMHVHLHQANSQRKYYESLRDIALRAKYPVSMWVLSTDGMDQSKTTMPHPRRETKSTEPWHGLMTHVVSTVIFGAPVPLLGFVNLADIAKNSSLTAQTLMRTLEIQWKKLVEMKQASDDYARANALPVVEGPIPAGSWPERLHICFVDNAVGENMNKNVFMTLAIFVHHRVFKEVSIGTFFVGHTHNINDQMFRVWRKYLDRTPVLSVKS